MPIYPSRKNITNKFVTKLGGEPLFDLVCRTNIFVYDWNNGNKAHGQGT
jgi:hypothetical protein